MASRLAGALLLAGVAAAAASGPATVTISNTLPKRDNTGAIMDAHDGKVIHVNGLYYWYAASYGNCTEPAGPTGCSGAAPGACGFQLNHNVSLWTSTDLYDWTYQGIVFQAATSGLTDPVMFCPKVLYNKGTSTWVMWINPIVGSNFGDSYYAVATSATPAGPFKLVSPNVTTLAFSDVGDFNLFLDDDGSAYVIYTSHIQGYQTTHQMSVEKLTADYTASLGAAASSGFFGASFVEAPMMFKRAGTYYAVFGSCCCYCQSGNPVVVYTASSPLGPYTTQGPIDMTGPTTTSKGGNLRAGAGGCEPAQRGRAAEYIAAMLGPQGSTAPASTSTCTRGTGLKDSGIHAQSTDIFAYTDGSGTTQYMFVGDRWQQSPDGLKAHDPTYWGPLSFAPNGSVLGMTFLDNFTITVTA